MDSSDTPNLNTLILIILCGLVGSGKSTFATALQREFPEFRRCNQDELGRREDVEREVSAALSQGLSVCVDRTNFDPSQRRTWIDIARQYSNVEIWGITMDTPMDTCHARLIERKNHPTLRTPEKAVEVLSRFSSQFVPIKLDEGFNRLYSLTPNGSPDYTSEELENILAAVRETPFAPSPDFLPPVSNGSRGRGGRGRGSFPTHGYRGQGPSNSHGWRGSHHASPSSWGPNPRDMPPQQDSNWRTQGPTNTYRGRGYPNRGWGGYRGRGGATNYSSSPEQSHGNYGPYPRGGPPPAARYQSTPRPIPPLRHPDQQPLESSSSDVPGAV
ncbi:AAA domain protein [Rhizoctonia solani AG-3 Rhs1AP]|uniref:AAA domain protein n=1 Tax=Rhizoctonia solani AG-3 Rhs1AP TaxID=1086054 RepID=X8J131_9AGAM|nr:AAA domain protein [Rhizoctonia solani AG-3 Rhs1AP]